MIITILAAHDEASEYLQYFLSGSTLSWKTTNNTNTTNIRRREKSRNDVIITLRNNWIYILDVRKLRISFRNNVRSTVCVCVCVCSHKDPIWSHRHQLSFRLYSASSQIFDLKFMHFELKTELSDLKSLATVGPDQLI